MNNSDLRLYLIASSSSFNEPLADLETAFKSGVTCFQLREKGSNIKSGQALIDFAKEVKVLCKKYEVPLIINDDVELAESIDADGIHIGQDDMKPEDLPVLFNDKIIGLSVGNMKELLESQLGKVSYLGVGPVYSTTSKDDAGAAIGIEGLKQLAGYTYLPIAAIGGITTANYTSCLENGADGICVISAITQADNIEKTVTALLQ